MSPLSRRGAVATSRRRTTVFNPLTQVTPTYGWWAEDPNWRSGVNDPGNGNPVTIWHMGGSSGSGDVNTGGGTARPIFRTAYTQLGSKPAFEFDGVDDILLSDVADIAQPYKAICVVRIIVATANTTYFGHGAAASSGLGLNASSRWQLNNGTNLVEGSGTADTVAGHVIRTTSNSASNSQHWRDGTSTVGPGDSGSGSFTRFKMGCGGAGTHSRFTNCALAFAAIYPGATSDTDLATLAADLKTYYGL